MTASVTRSPRYLPASSASLRSTRALISSGEYSLPRTLNRASPSGPATTSNETALASDSTSSKRRPTKRLAEEITELVVPRSMPTVLAMPPSCQLGLLLVADVKGLHGSRPRVLHGGFPYGAAVRSVAYAALSSCSGPPRVGPAAPAL